MQRHSLLPRSASQTSGIGVVEEGAPLPITSPGVAENARARPVAYAKDLIQTGQGCVGLATAGQVPTLRDTKPAVFSAPSTAHSRGPVLIRKFDSGSFRLGTLPVPKSLLTDLPAFDLEYP